MARREGNCILFYKSNKLVLGRFKCRTITLILVVAVGLGFALTVVLVCKIVLFCIFLQERKKER